MQHCVVPFPRRSASAARACLSACVVCCGAQGNNVLAVVPQFPNLVSTNALTLSGCSGAAFALNGFNYLQTINGHMIIEVRTYTMHGLCCLCHVARSPACLPRLRVSLLISRCLPVPDFVCVVSATAA